MIFTLRPRVINVTKREGFQDRAWYSFDFVDADAASNLVPIARAFNRATPTISGNIRVLESLMPRQNTAEYL